MNFKRQVLDREFDRHTLYSSRIIAVNKITKLYYQCALNGRSGHSVLENTPIPNSLT